MTYIFYIGLQIKALSKKLDSMFKLFGTQQKTLELLGKGHSLQLDRSDLGIKISMAILENITNLTHLDSGNDEFVREWFKRCQEACERGELPGFKPSDFDLSFLDDEDA